MKRKRDTGAAEKDVEFKEPESQYILQTNDHNCGPTALYNLIKWAGYIPSLPILEKMCKSCMPFGTFYQEFNDTLDAIKNVAGLSVQFKFRPTVQEVREHVVSGGVVVLLYHWVDRASDNEKYYEKYYGWYYGEHYILVDAYQRGQFRVINDTPLAAVMWIKKRKLATFLLPFEYSPPRFPSKYDNAFPTAWFIKK
jgi:peptidase C39-like protein